MYASVSHMFTKHLWLTKTLSQTKQLYILCIYVVTITCACMYIKTRQTKLQSYTNMKLRQIAIVLIIVVSQLSPGNSVLRRLRGCGLYQLGDIWFESRKITLLFILHGFSQRGFHSFQCHGYLAMFHIHIMQWGFIGLVFPMTMPYAPSGFIWSIYQ